jgi:hypothetical protein
MCFATFERSAFRLQLLPVYDVSEEQEEFKRFLAGDSPPASREENSWLQTMAAQVKNGRFWINVHLLQNPLTPYLQYLIDWWYVHQANAGAKIRLLDAHFADRVHELTGHDFWLFDDARLFVLQYSPEGRLHSIRETTHDLPLAEARRARDFAVSQSEDLQTFLAHYRSDRLTE